MNDILVFLLQLTGIYLTGVSLCSFLIGLFFPRADGFDPVVIYSCMFWPITFIVMFPVMTHRLGKKGYEFSKKFGDKP